jgi:hypothetical protein
MTSGTGGAALGQLARQILLLRFDRRSAKLEAKAMRLCTLRPVPSASATWLE